MPRKRSFRLVRNLSLPHMYEKEGFWTRCARQNDVLLYLVNFLEWTQIYIIYSFWLLTPDKRKVGNSGYCN